MKRFVPILAALLLLLAGCATSEPRVARAPMAIPASARIERRVVLLEQTPISTVADLMNSFAD